jgi:uncharacterized UPF0160 family protein
MSECGCIYVGIDNFVEMIKEEHIESARKKHRCSECDRVIQFGEAYDTHLYSFDNHTKFHKFCVDCQSLKKMFFCDGYEYGKIIERVIEHIVEMEGNISSDCIVGLTPGAREFVLDEIQAAYDDLNLDEEEEDK